MIRGAPRKMENKQRDQPTPARPMGATHKTYSRDVDISYTRAKRAALLL